VDESFPYSECAYARTGTCTCNAKCGVDASCEFTSLTVGSGEIYNARRKVRRVRVLHTAHIVQTRNIRVQARAARSICGSLPPSALADATRTAQHGARPSPSLNSRLARQQHRPQARATHRPQAAHCAFLTTLGPILYTFGATPLGSSHSSQGTPWLPCPHRGQVGRGSFTSHTCWWALRPSSSCVWSRPSP